MVFVGRITRQKGLPYLLRAARSLPPRRSWCCSPARRTPRRSPPRWTALAAELRATRDGVVWVQEMLPKPEVIQVLTHGTVFVCPSVYEPMGIVNLEAMACETAVVATATGGIPEVVADGETGLLVPIEQATDGSGTPLDPDRFVADLAAAITGLVTPRAGRRDRPGRAGAGGRALLLGVDRGQDRRGLPVGAPRRRRPPAATTPADPDAGLSAWLRASAPPPPRPERTLATPVVTVGICRPLGITPDRAHPGESWEGH